MPTIRFWLASFDCEAKFELNRIINYWKYPFYHLYQKKYCISNSYANLISIFIKILLQMFLLLILYKIISSIIDYELLICISKVEFQ